MSTVPLPKPRMRPNFAAFRRNKGDGRMQAAERGSLQTQRIEPLL
jgi:hypothetical protein